MQQDESLNSGSKPNERFRRTKSQLDDLLDSSFKILHEQRSQPIYYGLELNKEVLRLRDCVTQETSDSIFNVSNLKPALMKAVISVEK